MADIKIKEKLYNTKEKANSRLELEFSGSDMNHILLNTIRRTILLLIPNYAFTNCNIEINSSAYNNDMICLRINNIPAINIIPNTNTIELIDKLDLEEPVEAPVLSMVLDIENKTTEPIPVLTRDAQFFIDSKKAPDYPLDVLIMKLNPNQRLKLTATTNLGLPKKNDVYTSTAICCYEYDEEDKILFKLESRGNLDEYEIMKRACMIIINKLKFILDKISGSKIDDENKGSIILEKETFTMANLINDGLQTHKNIEFAGYKIDHLLIEESEIRYITDGKKGIKAILKESINHQVEIFNKIIKLLK
jgi:DNA-directed RNA polymerase subunit L